MVQALTPLTIGRSNIKATLMGALWGFGHSIGQLILGLLMVLLKVHRPSIISTCRNLAALRDVCVCQAWHMSRELAWLLFRPPHWLKPSAGHAKGTFMSHSRAATFPRC